MAMLEFISERYPEPKPQMLVIMVFLSFKLIRPWPLFFRLHVHIFVHTIGHMKIEFDPDKALLNPLNHDGVTFDEAKPVLFDPYALTREDVDSQGEARFVTLGMGSKGRILLVVWTLRGDNPRLISAWKANQQQRRHYEKQF